MGSARPKPKSRADIINIRDHFQGLLIQSRTYGELRWFTAGLGAMMRVGELDSTLDQLIAAGDTHAACDLMLHYGEQGQQWGTPQLVPDWNEPERDVNVWLPLVDRVIERGLIPIFVMPSEGQDGLQWTYDNLERIVAAMRAGYDRTEYGVFQFGYDGTWPASWSVDQVKAFLVWARSIIGNNSCITLMFGRGPAGNQYLWVEGEDDYSKPWMQCLDVVQLTSGPDQAVCPAPANLAAYMIPAEDFTPHGECVIGWPHGYIMGAGTSRGPYRWCFREWAEYEWTHFNPSFTAASIEADRQRVLSVGVRSIG